MIVYNVLRAFTVTCTLMVRLRPILDPFCNLGMFAHIVNDVPELGIFAPIWIDINKVEKRCMVEEFHIHPRDLKVQTLETYNQ